MNYAQIEKEALAILFGCTKFHQYVFGRHVLIESDHKPLKSIFKKPLHQAPPRLQRLMLSLMKYDIEVTYKSRKENPQKPTQLSSRSHPRHLVGKRTAQKTPS